MTSPRRRALIGAAAAIITMGGGVAVGVALTQPGSVAANTGRGDRPYDVAKHQTPKQCVLIDHGYYNAAPTNACDGARSAR
jgi:hypothetical protein